MQPYITPFGSFRKKKSVKPILNGPHTPGFESTVQAQLQMGPKGKCFLKCHVSWKTGVQFLTHIASIDEVYLFLFQPFSSCFLLSFFFLFVLLSFPSSFASSHLPPFFLFGCYFWNLIKNPFCTPQTYTPISLSLTHFVSSRLSFPFSWKVDR